MACGFVAAYNINKPNCVARIPGGAARGHSVSLGYKLAACVYENLDSDVVMKSTKDRVRFNASGRLNRTGDRRIFIQ